MTRERWKVIGLSHYYTVTAARPQRHRQSQLVALDRVSFSQPYGQIIGVIGGRGAGKSTLGAILSGQQRASEGLISGSTEIKGAFILPDHRYDERTGESYARQQLAKWGISKKKMPDLLAHIRSFSELGSQFGVKLKHYSLSEKSQLAISLLLHMAPTTLYLDDSLLVVKEHFYLKVWGFLDQLKALGSSIWVETEQVRRIERYCDQLMWLEFGQLKQYGDVMDVLAAYDEYYFQLSRLSLKEQQTFWEEGYQGQLLEKAEVVSQLVPPSSVDQQEVVKQEEPIEQEQVDQPTEELQDVAAPSRRHRQRPKKINRWPLILVVLGGLIIGGLGVAYPYLKASRLTLPQTGAKSSDRQPPVTTTSTSLLAEPSSSASQPVDLKGTYHVQAGETLSEIANTLGLSVAELREWNQLTNDHIQPNQLLLTVEPVAENPASNVALASFTHSVKAGESLATIGAAYQVSVAELQEANQLKDVTIYTGSQLALPASAKEPVSLTATTETLASSAPPVSDYVVLSGDTLYSIARKYGVDVMAIQQVNQLQSEQLSPGDVLTLP
ncbi:LysM peptidoglycan-binding domain-containing protein [Vagococcus sp. BWB3-3]|uniref:LysM peptidoglycan-binding domain-containing protein n=1 Tax=Vagococcus allomyrinae TaxID=2794353 RepID=A0A940STE9_9ENTE|nr:LysM peptidoglycan-binding domain-containing protein [Vagococcus allomyrinae]